ncbi:MAG TPA: hypothetical protein P5294_09730 [Smithellaceae bacterium]|nr:hypothetical protein [Smithellaceae bacterium]HRS90112.1 hypothetical protein [Smithellaceae bacterium]HRV26810.1 hypothetical protein [Smithellaceae bacterium]
MFSRQNHNFLKLILLAVLFIFGAAFLYGCASAPKTLNPAVTGPQVIANPESVSLGVANLLGKKIVFEGSGFKPDDSVFITLYGPDKIQLIVANGQVGADGKFSAEVELMTKITKFLNANVRGQLTGGSYERSIVITDPPIPAGTYRAKVRSLYSDETAETNLVVTEPSTGDRFKDWLGKKTGKIIDERPQ